MSETILNSGDTAWVLIATALVFLMTPGLALFYGGLVRAKSVLNTAAMTLAAMGIVSVLWVIYGFSLVFGSGGKSPWYGAVTFSGLSEVTNSLTNNGGVYPIPLLGFAAFQLTFAIITVALISGAIAERAKFLSWCIFVGLWSTFVYFPVAHWVFSFGEKIGETIIGAGFLALRGVQDFAGGSAVHINAGAAALALAIVLGRSDGWKTETRRPHSIPLMLIGTALLWFGWFGFNAGSALGANAIAGLALVNTQIAAAAALTSWSVAERLRAGANSLVGTATGAIAGLVAITPACAFVEPWAAVVIGFVAGICCYFALELKHKFNFDDTLDVFGIHFVGGVWGCIAIGFLGSSAANPLGANGFFYGGGIALLGKQILGVLLVSTYSFLATLVIGYFIARTIGFRVERKVEITGIDIFEHSETAYEITHPKIPVSTITKNRICDRDLELSRLQ